MDTNRNLLKACIASLVLCASASAVGAQTIYKQVDAGGRIVFTDRPNPEARVLASYESSRLAKRPDTEADEAVAEPVRKPVAEMGVRFVAPTAPLAPEIMSAAEPAGEAWGAPPKPVSSRSFNDVERAVTNYTPLKSPLALQVDATESARRARQEMNKSVAASGVLIVKPAPREREPIAPHEGISSFYVLWATTFFLLAAGLLYVGWQTFRVILRGAFPRWQLGIA